MITMCVELLVTSLGAAAAAVLAVVVLVHTSSIFTEE